MEMVLDKEDMEWYQVVIEVAQQPEEVSFEQVELLQMLPFSLN
jgi:hypothetical protein